MFHEKGRALGAMKPDYMSEKEFKPFCLNCEFHGRTISRNTHRRGDVEPIQHLFNYQNHFNIGNSETTVMTEHIAHECNAMNRSTVWNEYDSLFWEQVKKYKIDLIPDDVLDDWEEGTDCPYHLEYLVSKEK